MVWNFSKKCSMNPIKITLFYRRNKQKTFLEFSMSIFSNPDNKIWSWNHFLQIPLNFPSINNLIFSNPACFFYTRIPFQFRSRKLRRAWNNLVTALTAFQRSINLQAYVACADAQETFSSTKFDVKFRESGETTFKSLQLFSPLWRMNRNKNKTRREVEAS